MLAQTTQTATEILTRVEQYYNNAFTSALWFLVIALAAVSLLASLFMLLMHFLQRHSFDKREELLTLRLRNETKEAVKKATNLFKGNIHETLRELFRQSSWFWYEMSRIALGSSEWGRALPCWCYSINNAIRAGRPPQDKFWERLRKSLVEYKDSPSMKDTAWRDTEIRETITWTVGLLKEQPNKEPYSELRDILENLLIRDEQSS